MARHSVAASAALAAVPTRPTPRVTKTVTALGPLTTLARRARKTLDVALAWRARPTFVSRARVGPTRFAARATFVPASRVTTTPFTTSTGRALTAIARRATARILVAALWATGAPARERFAGEVTLASFTALWPFAAAIGPFEACSAIAPLRASTPWAIAETAWSLITHGPFGDWRSSRLERRSLPCLATFTVEQHERGGCHFDGVHAFEERLHDRDPREVRTRTRRPAELVAQHVVRRARAGECP